MRLRSHLVVVVLAALLPMAAFSAAMLFRVHRQTQNATDRGLQDTARAIAVAVDHELGGTIAALKVLAVSEDLGRGRLDAFHDVARKAVATQPTWQNVVLYAPSGQVLVNTLLPAGVAPRPGGNVEPVLRAVRDRVPVVSDLFVGRLTSRPLISVVIPIFEGRSPSGALAAIVPAGNLLSVLSEQALPSDWVATIIDRRGIIVARTRALEQWQGQPATPVFAGRAQRADSGTFRDVTRDGVAVYGAFSRAHVAGWTVGLGAPVAAVGPSWLATLGVTAGAAVACLLAAGLLAAAFARRIATGMRNLATAAHALGRGALPPESAPSPIAEVRAVEAELAAAARERGVAQAALARSTERLDLLHEIDRAIIEARAPVEIAEVVLRRLRDLLEVPRAVVNLFDEDAGEAAWLAAAGRRRLVLEPDVRFPLDLMGDVEALRRGEVQIVDVAARAPGPEVDALRASGVEVYMVIPMIALGELIGGLSFGGARRDFPEEQVGIAREVAAQFAIAIAQRRLHERVRRQAEELERRVEERTRALSLANARLEDEVGERRRAEAEAERASRAKSEFLAGMSHELRTPLNAIIGFSQLLHDGKVGPIAAEHREYLGDILTSARHLLQLINDVLDLARVESGRLELNPEPIDAGALVREVSGVVQGLAERKRLRLDTSIDPALGPLVLDPGKLKQVLYNYLSNAIKFTPEGGRVSVRARPDGAAAVRFEVEDTGIGIGADDLSRLFVEFVQIDPASGIRHEGTGLGLALTKRLVEAQGGRVGVRSTPGEGSLFFAVLPRTAP